MKDDEMPKSFAEVCDAYAELLKESRSAGIDVILMMRQSSLFDTATRVSLARNCDDIVAYGLVQFAFDRINNDEDEAIEEES
jgi:hypothetical protein